MNNSKEKTQIKCLLIKTDNNVQDVIFDFEDDNVKKVIKTIVEEKDLFKKNIKEKNNFKIFSEMTKEEFEEIIEKELIDFLQEIVE